MRNPRRSALIFIAGLALGAGLVYLVAMGATPGQQRPAISHPVQTTAIASTSPPASPEQSWPSDSPTPEQVFYAQPDLLDREIAQLKSRTPGKVNLYAIVFAGDGSESVFRNEAEYFDELFSRRLGAQGHVIVLENNPDSIITRPLATWTNLEGALDAVATKMDLQQDILLLYFTSHGSRDHTLLVDMDPLPLDQIGAGDLPGILAEHSFKYKVVIVNACYSGGFIPPLKSSNTMVITAARADRSSFGCGEQSQLTWFGHAFLVDALNKTDDFRQAFKLARGEVAQWEKRDGYEPSDPQISIGSGITAQLARWRKSFTPRNTVKFSPAPTLPAMAASTSTAR